MFWFEERVHVEFKTSSNAAARPGLRILPTSSWGVRCPLSKPELENDLKAMPITVLSFSTFSSDTLNVLFLLC